MTYSPARHRDLGLDLVRAFAIVLVLVGHGIYAFFFGLTNPGPPLLLLGYFGVEVFFVLSGFLIGQILLKTIFVRPTFAELRIFWSRRWLRTLPAYYVVLAALTAIGILGPAHSWRWEYLSYFGFAQNIFPPDIWNNFFGVGWSLAIEEWFYLVAPLALLIIMRLGGAQRRRQSLIGTLALFILGPLLARLAIVAWAPTDWGTMRKMILPRFDAISLGFLAASVEVLWPDLFSRWRSARRSCLLLGLAGIAVLAVFFKNPPSLLDGVFMRTFGFSATCACLAVMLPACLIEDSRSSLFSRAATFVSATSYSVYLVHGEIFEWLRNSHPAPHSWAASCALAISGLAAAYVCAWLLHIGVEKPFMRWRDRPPAALRIIEKARAAA